MRLPILASLVASLIACAFALPPTALRCENRVDPLGVEAAMPRLSWQLQAAPGQTNQSQSAYRILVASSEGNLSANIGDLWDQAAR
ncbi:MAG: hypothetical protein EAZ84_12440 [Verrucomicrobia bacterium]|nr:MAG: hypothetical protein EAZ84_12440 [Verrucomicrobiota bacterium]TAE90426.1 MAG: hypothetical protein EAZ81_10140 [Verrucomicrobiota bacterium]